MEKFASNNWLKNPHLLSLKDLQQQYQVDVRQGLKSAQAKELLRKNGRNQIEVLKDFFSSHYY